MSENPDNVMPTLILLFGLVALSAFWLHCCGGGHG